MSIYINFQACLKIIEMKKMIAISIDSNTINLVIYVEVLSDFVNVYIYI